MLIPILSYIYQKSTFINTSRKLLIMSYNNKILRKFLEMPMWGGDTELELGNQSPKDQDINDKRLASLSRQNKLINKMSLSGNISIEMLESQFQTNLSVYLIQTISNKRHVIGLLDIMDNGLPYPSVQMSYVHEEFWNNGYSSKMYKMAFNYLGGLISDAKLTGEKRPGSFNIWLSLGKKYFSYVIDQNGIAKEVGQFDRSMMNSEETRFMVTEDEYEEDANS